MPPSTHSMLWTFLRYAATGGVATAMHYALLMALVEGLRVSPPWAAMVGALAGALVAYQGNRRYAFQGTGVGHRRAVPRFLAVAVAGAAMSGGIVWIATQGLGLNYLAAQALATLAGLGATFMFNRYWTFA